MAELKRASNLKAPVSHCFAAGHINIAVVAPGEIVLASFRPVFLLPHSVNAADEFVGVNHCLILLDMVCCVLCVWHFMRERRPAALRLSTASVPALVHGHQVLVTRMRTKPITFKKSEHILSEEPPPKYSKNVLHITPSLCGQCCVESLSKPPF